MTIAINVLQTIERLTVLARTNPGPNAQALVGVREMLTIMGLNNGATGYKAEKLNAVMDDFVAWFGAQCVTDPTDVSTTRIHLLHDIEHLKKVLARWSESQD
jgi:hypothetical protein